MKINEDYLANILFQKLQTIGVARSIEDLTIKELRHLALDISRQIERDAEDDEPPF